MLEGVPMPQISRAGILCVQQAVQKMNLPIGKSHQPRDLGCCGAGDRSSCSRIWAAAAGVRTEQNPVDRRRRVNADRTLTPSASSSEVDPMLRTTGSGFLSGAAAVRSSQYLYATLACCCCGCRDVGNAQRCPSFSLARSVISTAHSRDDDQRFQAMVITDSR